MKKYYYASADRGTVGPVLYSELKVLQEQGEVNSETYVTEEGASEWIHFANISGTEESSSQTSLIVHGAGKRYSDAYLVARSVTAVGKACKVIAILSGVAIVVGSAALQVQLLPQGTISDNTRTSLLILIVVIGFLVAVPIFVLGILVEANGQILKANLDCAVHTSPFLSKEEMASAMKIK